MHRFETIAVPIRRDYDACYAQLSDPWNYPRWSPIPDARFEPVDDSERKFRVDLPRGRRILRFSPQNDYGVLDYAVHSEEGAHETTAFLRLVPNGEGCVLVALYSKPDDVDDAQFDSDMEWVANDLKAIAAALEAD